MRGVSEDRGGDPNARLIRTEKEVEGKYTEQWILVEEDPLDQWPAGPLETVGRAAPRFTGRERARGEAVYTADLQLPGMLHAAVLRSPHARARLRSLGRGAAAAAPGARAVRPPDALDVLTREPEYQGAAVAAVVADTHAQARAALALIQAEWEVREPLPDPDDAVRRGSLIDDPKSYERGDVDRALADADVV